MDDFKRRAIEREAADALLDAGISVPLKELRLPFLRRGITLRVTLRRPRLSGQIRFARIYLETGMDAGSVDSLDQRGQMAFMAEHGVRISEMVACALCVGSVREHFIRPVAWLLRHCVEHRYLLGAADAFAGMMGTGPFMSIIRLAERTNPLKPRLSQIPEGS